MNLVSLKLFIWIEWSSSLQAVLLTFDKMLYAFNLMQKKGSNNINIDKLIYIVTKNKDYTNYLILVFSTKKKKKKKCR